MKGRDPHRHRPRLFYKENVLTFRLPRGSFVRNLHSTSGVRSPPLKPIISGDARAAVERHTLDRVPVEGILLQTMRASRLQFSSQRDHDGDKSNFIPSRIPSITPFQNLTRSCRLENKGPRASNFSRLPCGRKRGPAFVSAGNLILSPQRREERGELAKR